jgi:hypothetical protein
MKIIAAPKKAFTVLELSIVILVVSTLFILLSGSAKKAIEQSRLMTARALTKNSPVNATPDLSLWLETTMAESFDDLEADNNKTVTNWYDLSPNDNNASQVTVGSRPTYKSSVINNLPALSFVNAGADYLNLPNGTVPYGDSAYTIFFVFNYNSACTCGLLGSGNYSTNNQVLAFRYDATKVLYDYWWNVDISTVANAILPGTTAILDSVYDRSNRFLYINGTLNASAVASGRQSTSANNTVGKSYNTEYMDGYIAEVIVFNRNLVESERKAIERYLGKKWGITVS